MTVSLQIASCDMTWKLWATKDLEMEGWSHPFMELCSENGEIQHIIDDEYFLFRFYVAIRMYHETGGVISTEFHNTISKLLQVTVDDDYVFALEELYDIFMTAEKYGFFKNVDKIEAFSIEH